MQPLVMEYLYDIRAHLHLPPAEEKQILGELYTHFEEEIKGLEKKYEISEEEAAGRAVESFGRAREVARLMDEAYGKASWTDALMMCLPHVLVAFLFGSHLWDHHVLLLIVFLSIVGVTLFGWWRGKPGWLYSWIGYSLLPLLVVVYTTRSVPYETISLLIKGQAPFLNMAILGVLFIFYACVLWFLITTMMRVIKRDWLLASLMLVPMPLFGCWLINTEKAGSLWSLNGLYQWDSLMAFCLLVIGITTLTFMRLRERHLKIMALVTLGSLSFTVLTYNIWGVTGFFSTAGLALFMLVFLLAPALLEARAGHGKRSEDGWWPDTAS
jgi:hypothetical protein